MGLFSSIFGSSSNIEKKLKDQYIPIFQMMGMSANDFFETLKQIKEESLKEGTINLPLNYGDVLLEKESTDRKINTMLAKKRKESVRDEDIKWWWNIHDYERRIMLKIDEISRIAMYMDSIEKGMKQDDAAARIRKYHPMYGDPDDTSHTTGEDRPLPYELKDRVNIYVEKRSKGDVHSFKKEVEESSTFNALVRKAISKKDI